MRSLLTILAVMGGATAALADASLSSPPRPAPAKVVRWLTGHDGLPAAAVAERSISSPRAEVDCSWVTAGSRWRVVDRLGASVGEARVTRLERDENWPCKMATFSGPMRRARLLVERAAEAPRPTAQWTPAAADRAALEALVGGRRSPMNKSMLFFETAAGRFAVMTNEERAVIARWVGSGAWAIEWKAPRGKRTRDEHHYNDPAAVDLDGDGEPEVILGFYYDTEYGDLVIGRGGAGAGASWRMLAESFEGNTI